MGIDPSINCTGICIYDDVVLEKDSAYCYPGFANKDKIRSFHNPCDWSNLVKVKRADLWGFINKEGREIIPCKYDIANSFSDGLAAVMCNNKWGFIDKDGKEVIPSRYTKMQLIILLQYNLPIEAGL